MFNSNLRIAWRVMLRNKTATLFSVSGLVLGLSGALLMGLWLQNEASFDAYHQDLNRIYKVYNQQEVSGELTTWDFTPRVLAPTLKSDFSFIECASSYANYGSDFVFQHGEKKMVNKNGIFTDPDFLKMFSFDVLAGDVNTALDEPNAIVLTASFARLMFGHQNVLGETITISSQGHSFEFEISAVLEDMPSNTEFNFEYIIGFRFVENVFGKDENWNNNSVRTFVRLRSNTDADEANNAVRNLVKKHTDAENEPELLLYPFSKVHLYGQFENGKEAGGRIEIMRVMGLLAIALVLIACINFINISTARAQKRAKEIGIRKTIGAGKNTLRFQFLFESVLLVLISGTGALVLATYMMPYFGSMIDQQLVIPWSDPGFWLIYFVFLVIVGLLAGVYPSVYLSALKPVQSIKMNAIAGKGLIRKGLVVLQFGFAIMLIFSTLVIRQQIEHLQNRQSGYARENLIYHPLTAQINQHFDSYKTQLLESRFVESVTRTSAPLTSQFSNTFDMEWRNKEPGSKIVIERFFAGSEFLSTIGVQLVEGREMNLNQFASDSNAVLLNETAVRTMGFDDPIGEEIRDNDQVWKVVGVVQDFVLFDPQGEIPAIVIFNGSNNWFNGVHVRLKGDIDEALLSISDAFRSIDNTYPFDYSFIENEYEAKFSGVRRTLMISSVFGLIIVLIACAGLFALSLYVINSRLKEIGIRKVFGSSSTEIVQLICWNSLKPIIMAILFFAPIAWFSMDWWLNSYPYRIHLDASYIISSGLLLLIIALATVIVQTIRAARTNPADVLGIE